MSRPSLSRRLLTLVAMVTIAGVAGDVLLWRDLDRRLRTEAIDHARDLASLIAAEIGIVLQQPVVDLGRAVARLNDGQGMDALDRYMRGSSLVSQIISMDRDGRVLGVLPVDRELVGLDWSRQPMAIADGDGVHWSETFLSPDRADPGVTISQPWRGGTLAFRVDLGQLSQLVAVASPPPGGFVAVVDKQGVAIGHSRPESARQRENLRDLVPSAPADERTSTDMTAWQGNDGLLCSSRIPGCGWSVLVFQPASHAFEVARKGSLLSFGVILGVIVLVVLMFLAIRRMLVRALEGFSDQMQRVAAGQPAALAGQPAELAPLAASFGEMAAAVAAREAELKRSHAEFRDLVEGVGSVILRLDAKGRILYMNPAGVRLFGWGVAELSGRHVLGTIVPETDQHGRRLQPMVESALGDPDALHHNENENITRDGRRLWMSWANRGLHDADGRLIGVLSVGTDLTKQVRGERAFQALVEAMAAAAGESFYDAATASLESWLECDVVLISRVVAGRLDGIVMRSGGSVRREEDCGMLAGSPCEVALRDGWLLVEDRLDQRFPREDIVAKALKAYAGLAVPGGKAILACMWKRPVQAPPRLRQVLELIARRIGAEMEAQDLRERFAHAERLEALGKLAGGVAHDFNNQLAVILASADLLRPRLNEPRSASLLGGIITAADRSSALTARLLAFARRGSIENGPIDAHAAVIETALLAERTFDPAIVVSHDLHAGRSIVMGNAGLLNNALLNLALNARDAMPAGGRLRFSSRNEGGLLVLEVEDSGCGMDAAVQARLFEPFFTTKPEGKGNGLGLPAVYGTVTGMGGTIAVRSALGSGTTFVVSLPPCDPPSPESGPHGLVPVPVKGRILLAEDEPVLRQVVGDFLKGLGYAVTVAADGQEAIDAFAAAPTGFDLALLDAMLPARTGLQVFECIRAVAPGLPVVVVSGFGAEGQLESFRCAGVPVLAKPCRLDHLAKTIGTALRNRPG